MSIETCMRDVIEVGGLFSRSKGCVWVLADMRDVRVSGVRMNRTFCITLGGEDVVVLRRKTGHCEGKIVCGNDCD
jgi:hypothetical protein